MDEPRKLQDITIHYFEFTLAEHKPLRQLRISSQTQGILLALLVPTLLASLLRLCGFQARERILESTHLRQRRPYSVPCISSFNLVPQSWICSLVTEQA